MASGSLRGVIVLVAALSAGCFADTRGADAGVRPRDARRPDAAVRDAAPADAAIRDAATRDAAVGDAGP